MTPNLARSTRPVAEPTAILEVQGLAGGFGQRGRSSIPAVIAFRDVNMRVHRGEIVAVVGESGSGKSTFARSVAGLHPAYAGVVTLSQRPLAAGVARRSRDDRRRVQIVSQIADTALNPAHSVGRTLGRVLEVYTRLSGSARVARIAALLEMVDLPPSYATRFPPELSGGQKQRVNLARALAAEPSVLLCDEITSALDIVVGESIMGLLEDLRRQMGLAIVLVSHDLPTVARVANQVLVLQRGIVVEQGDPRDLLANPQHAYTRLLVGSIPALTPGWLEQADATRTRLEAELQQAPDCAVAGALG